jgi:hypothetical protein
MCRSCQSFMEWTFMVFQRRIKNGVSSLCPEGYANALIRHDHANG